MAENADIELTVGGIVDVASITKAGQQIRSMLQRYVADSLSFIGVGAPQSLGALSGAKTGLEVYSHLSELRRELQKTKRNLNRMGLMDATEEAVINSVIESVGLGVNVSRRTSINEPVNKLLSARRAAEKEALAHSSVLSSNSVSAAVYRNVLGRGMTADERSRARADAMSVWAPIEEDPRQKVIDSQKTYAAIYRNIYSKGFTADERARAEEDARAVWAVRDNTKALKQLSVIATNVVASGLKTFAEVLPTYWHENVTRSTFGRLEAEAARAKSYGRFGGTALGSVLGGVIGGVIGSAAGPAGSAAGAAYGASILGSAGGAAGALWGDYKGERLQSVKRSIQQVQQRYRAYGIYGGQYGVGYANAVAETGMASASDVEKMTHNSATLGARMMFGQVGENEMLMYSLMPGYFAAAMSGASSEKLAEAFAADLDKLPPQLRVWAAESVGGGSLGMMAFANSPNFGYVQAHAGETRAYDAAQMLAGAGFQVQSGVRGIIDRRAETSALYSDVAYAMGRPRAGVWQPADYGAELALTESKIGQVYPWMARRAYANAERYITSSDPETVAKGMGIANRATQRVLQTINVNIDGETVKSQENVITEDELNGGYSLSYTLGM